VFVFTADPNTRPAGYLKAATELCFTSNAKGDGYCKSEIQNENGIIAAANFAHQSLKNLKSGVDDLALLNR
jgi:hypothetical protein